MIKLRIHGRRYRVPTCWEDITISRCVGLYNRITSAPPDVQEYYRSFSSEGGPKMPKDALSLTTFATEAIAYISGIPEAIATRMYRGELYQIAMAILPRFVCGVLGYVDYVCLGEKSFRWHCRRYHYPASGSDVMGELTPLSSLSAVEFCQVSDIVVSGNIALAPLAVALCCRPRGEVYNETLAQKRAIRFMVLPSSVYWELWTRVSAAHTYLKNSFPNCYGKESKDEDGAASKGVMWCDTLVSLALGRPSDLTYLQRMNSYDFVHLLSENIKKTTEEWKMKSALSGLGAVSGL